MIIEVDELDFSRYAPAQLRAARPDIVRLADLTRRNLHHLESALGVEARQKDLHHNERLSRELHEAHALADALQDDLDDARTRIADLERRLAGIEDDAEVALYASVGLVATAHKVVVHSARRALLAHYHPDDWQGKEKVWATANFQAASAAFDRIKKLRKC